MTLLAQHADAEVHHCDWRSLADVVRERGGCDALIVDAPYSERTHAGHDASAGGHLGEGRDTCERRSINYAAWSSTDVRSFVDEWSPLTRGWIVTVTDHALAPEWAVALELTGRYVFAPLAFVAPGSRVRLSGDGPSQWATWIVVARPREVTFSRWGTLPGAYVLPPGHAERMEVTGGKPLWLMERLVEDYSRPGDLVVDPCCGAGTTLVAAQRTGRKSIGGDVLREHAELAAKRISRPAQQPLFAAGGRS